MTLTREQAQQAPNCGCAKWRAWVATLPSTYDATLGSRQQRSSLLALTKAQIERDLSRLKRRR